MTAAQKKLRELKERQSKDRQRIVELGLADSLTDETRAELDQLETSIPDLERQLRAATLATETEETEARESATVNELDTEMRERIELRGRANLTNYFLAAARGRMVDGAEAELQAAAGVQNIPLELWDIPRPEQRDVTPAPGTSTSVNLDAIRPAVFANSIAPRLGIEMPRVLSGSYASGTITTSQDAAAKAKSAAAEGTAGAITVTSATPKRISARLELTLEDIATVGPENFESILRENLALALSDELDDQVINGNGAAPNLSGILNGLTDPDAPTDVADFDAFALSHAGGVDGLWATGIKDVSIVCGPATYRLAAATFQTATNYKGEMSAAAYAMGLTGGFWTNKRMPAADANIQQGILYRGGRSMMMGGAGAMRTAVCPHWNEVSIDDIFSGSAKGERYFTMHVLVGDVILVQPNAYAQVAFKLA